MHGAWIVREPAPRGQASDGREQMPRERSLRCLLALGMIPSAAMASPPSPSPGGLASMQVTVPARDVRALARRRVGLSLAAIPLLLIVGVSAVMVSGSLALIAVLCAFFAYAAASVAARQRHVARAAAELALTLDGDRILLEGQAPRRLTRAIDRPEYLRLLGTHQRVASYWLDARRDPTAFVDVPGPRAERERLHEALVAAGVPLRREGSATRVVALGAAIALALGGLTIARVALGLAATTVLAAPLTWAVAAAVLAALVWVWRRTR